MGRQYFTSLNIPTNHRIGIDSITGPITIRKSSHKGAWAKIIRAQLKQLGYQHVFILDKTDKWADYDCVLLEHGMEFKGTFNVFGGANDELADRIQQFVDCISYGVDEQRTRFVSCDIPMPDLATWVQSRKSTCSNKFMALDVEELRFCQGQVNYYERLMASTGIVIGDSHSLAVWQPGWELFRLDGKTLHGALEAGLHTLLDPHHEHVVCYFGNIDIRHHLMRQDNPHEAIQQLMCKYYWACSQLGKNVTVVRPLPIEDESRKLPKTGYYRGTPFHGTWAQREWVRQWMNHWLNEWFVPNGIQVVDWPEGLVDLEGKLKFDCMEAGSSVHLSPMHYRTNLETGEVRW